MYKPHESADEDSTNGAMCHVLQVGVLSTSIDKHYLMRIPYEKWVTSGIIEISSADVETYKYNYQTSYDPVAPHTDPTYIDVSASWYQPTQSTYYSGLRRYSANDLVQGYSLYAAAPDSFPFLIPCKGQPNATTLAYAASLLTSAALLVTGLFLLI